MHPFFFIYTFVLAGFFSTLYGQEEDFHYLPNYIYAENDTITVTNGGNVRQSPSRNAKSIDQLEVGAKVIITGEGIGEETIFGMLGYYLPVQYMMNSTTKKGYIWSGLLAYTTSVDKAGNEYAIGAKRFIKGSEERLVEYNLIRKDKQSGKLYQQLIQKPSGGQSGYESKTLGAMGLTSVQTIFRIGFLGEACGIYTEYLYYAWVGDKFVELPQKSSVGDAGIYYSSDKLLFPTEHKYGANIIIVETEEAETEFVSFIEGIDVLEEVITKTQRWFKWDGKKCVELEKKTLDY